jgi:hypothetical protein
LPRPPSWRRFCTNWANLAVAIALGGVPAGDAGAGPPRHRDATTGLVLLRVAAVLAYR